MLGHHSSLAVTVTSSGAIGTVTHVHHVKSQGVNPQSGPYLGSYHLCVAGFELLDIYSTNNLSVKQVLVTIHGRQSS